MTRRIFYSIFTAAMAVLLASLVVLTGVLYGSFTELEEGRLRSEMALAARAVEVGGAAYLEELQPGATRLTWVAADGTVLFDTQGDPAAMENHGQREEIQEALETGEGESARYSDTLTEQTLYYARRLSDGTVLRVSVNRDTVLTLVLGLIRPAVAMIVLAAVVAILLARRMAEAVVGPLNRLDLDHPLESEAYEELSPLLSRIHQLHGQIDTQLRHLRQKTEEFDQVTESMSEGLVLLNEHGMVLSINPAARRLFHAEGCRAGDDFLTVDRSHDLSTAIRAAKAEGHSRLDLTSDGREIRLDVSRIQSEGVVRGTVLLAFDVTEQASAERSRREFTANVSHELKTPLQSILGRAELIENGLVKPEDLPRFAGHIRTEAARLVTLIEDIIRLSQLDEGGPMPREDVDLYTVALESAAALQETAAAKGVRLTVQGQPAVICGVRRLLSEIAFNLCENAVKYNVEGGTVEVSVEERGGDAVLTVRDTGIGIPAEHQARVFERFYRVDKSHSRESGGTGLGLSIVKHAAACHHARIDLTSAPGEGTTISVVFPRGLNAE